MNHRDIESLDESTRELLLAEKTPPGAPASARARVFSRLEASASAPNAGGTRTSHPRSSGARGIAERGALGKAGPLAVAFVAGAAAGVAGDRWLASSTPPTAPYLQTSASAAEPISAALPDPAPSSAAPVSTAPAKAPPSASAPAESDLGAERALLDRARAVFAAGDPARRRECARQAIPKRPPRRGARGARRQSPGRRGPLRRSTHPCRPLPNSLSGELPFQHRRRGDRNDSMTEPTPLNRVPSWRRTP